MGNFQEKDFINAIEKNCVNLRKIFSVVPGTILTEAPGLTWLDSSINYPTWNAAVQTRLTVELLPEKIRELKHYFREKKLPFSWWVTPNSRPEELNKHLPAVGFKLRERSPAMLKFLSLAEKQPVKKSGFEIQEISDTAKLKDYLRIIEISYQMPPFCTEFSFKLYKMLATSENNPFIHYLGYLEGTPAATAALFISENIAGIHLVGTLPEFRGKGLGSLMTRHCMNEAARMGFPFVILRASEMGYRIYLNLGFKKYFDFEFYTFNPKHA